VLIELFLLGVTAEALQANIGSKSAISLQQGPVDPIFQVEGVVPTRQTDRQTDRQNYVRPRLHSMQRSKNELQEVRFMFMTSFIFSSEGQKSQIDASLF